MEEDQVILVDSTECEAEASRGYIDHGEEASVALSYLESGKLSATHDEEGDRSSRCLLEAALQGGLVLDVVSYLEEFQRKYIEDRLVEGDSAGIVDSCPSEN